VERFGGATAFFSLVEVQEERVPISSNVLLDCDPGERDMLVPYTVIVVCSFSGGFGARLLSSTQELDDAFERDRWMSPVSHALMPSSVRKVAGKKAPLPERRGDS
jgi:hypothetical protein